MKNKKDNTNKIVSALNYLSSICFYIIAIIKFLNSNNSIGYIYLLLGVIFMCLGTVYYNKIKK